MALIATLSQPIDYTSVDHVPLPIAQRFPVPPTAWGFMTDMPEVEELWVINGLTAPYYLNGAVFPEGLYMEPTTGQIWPRIG